MDKTQIKLYHASRGLVKYPEIRITEHCPDFYFGFYCTLQRRPAELQAARLAGQGIVSEFLFVPKPDLLIKRFPEMTEEWLDFIAACRLGIAHDYDIVEGPMVEGSVFAEVQNFIDGNIPRNVFWEQVREKRAVYQMSFHTARALSVLKFTKAYRLL